MPRLRIISTVTVVTGAIPTRRPRIAGAVSAFARRTATRATAGAKAVADRLSGSVLTIAGLASVDVGAFEAQHIAGWIVTGASILLLDWVLE